jgi:hypothetical protein
MRRGRMKSWNWSSIVRGIRRVPHIVGDIELAVLRILVFLILIVDIVKLLNYPI